MLHLILNIALLVPAAAHQAPAPMASRTVDAYVIAYDWTVRLREPDDEFFERILVRIGDPENKGEGGEIAQVIYAYTDAEKHRPPDYFFRRQTRLRLQLPSVPSDDPTCELPTATTVAAEGEEGEPEMVELPTFTRNSGLKGEMPDLATIPCYVIGPGELEIVSHD